MNAPRRPKLETIDETKASTPTAPLSPQQFHPDMTKNKALAEQFLGCIKKDDDSTEVATLKAAIKALSTVQSAQDYEDALRVAIAKAYADAYMLERTKGRLFTDKGASILKTLDDAINKFNKMTRFFSINDDLIPEDKQSKTEAHVFMSVADKRDFIAHIFEKTMSALLYNNVDKFVNCIKVLARTGKAGLGEWDLQVKEKLKGNPDLMLGRRMDLEPDAKIRVKYLSEEYAQETLYKQFASKESPVKSAIADYYKRVDAANDQKSDSKAVFFKPPKTAEEMKADREKEKEQLDEVKKNYPDLNL